MRIMYLLLFLLAGNLFTNPVFSSELPSPLVEASWLANNLQQVAIIDVRSGKKSFTTPPTFKKNKKTNKETLVRVGGHIPGASLVLYKNVRGTQTINGMKVKHMLPSKTDFEKLMQSAGINRTSNIVVTTNAESGYDLTMAARMYWQVKYFGHDNVSILNGGTAQWIADGHAVSTNAEKSVTGDWIAAAERSELLASSEEVDASIGLNSAQLVDVRPLGQYLGTYKSSKVKELGHIPTAKSLPVDLVASRSLPVKFSTAAELNKVTNALGIHNTGTAIAYCNSGHMASGGWFVLHEILGNKNAKLYDGSMHQWTKEKRPVVSMKME